LPEKNDIIRKRFVFRPSAESLLGKVTPVYFFFILFLYSLQNKGLKFSDVPTESEIAAAEQAYKLKQDLDGLDTSLVLNEPRKRTAASDASSVPSKVVKLEGSSGVSGGVEGKVSITAAVKKPTKFAVQDEEEEAEF
jgi:hypothetical protein